LHLYEGDPSKIFTEKMIADVFGVDGRVIEDPVEGTPMCIPCGLCGGRRERKAKKEKIASGI
jgi:hypothetical protein